MIVSGVLLLLLAAMQEIWQFYLLFGLGRALAVGESRNRRDGHRR